MIKYLLFYFILSITIGCSKNKPKASIALKNITELQHIKKDSITVKNPIHGIDVSKFQGEINWSSLQNKIQFAFCKATEGETYTDVDFKKNWEHLQDNNIIRGAYHFYRSNDNPIKQAYFFSKTVQPYLTTDIPLVLDIEKGSLVGQINKDSLSIQLITFLEHLEKLTNKKPVIYTSISFANEYLTSQKFNTYPLWIANYTTSDIPRLPNTWNNTNWLFWQKTDQYKETDISGNVDFDLFNGTTTDLNTFIRNSATKN